MLEPRPLYDTSAASPLTVDREFYARLANAGDRRTLVQRLELPVRSGIAWEVPRGHLCRIIAPEGPQVGDFNLWNRHNPRERFWAARTRQLQSAHIRVFDRLWSALPWLRPLATITADTVDYGVDEYGARCHDLLGTRCDPYVTKLISGDDYDFCCHSNLVRAVLPYGLEEADVHDVLNIFMATGLSESGDQYFVRPSPAREGDFLELFAELDLLCALSTCPGGDLSVPIWGPEATREPPCHPLCIEVHRPDDELLESWGPPEPSDYRGMHGLSFPREGRPLV